MNINKILIKTNSLLNEITFEEGSNSWYLTFDNNVSFSFETFWRLFNNDIPILISNDHRQQFGLPKPVDLIAEFKSQLDKKTLKEILIEKNTGDLSLTFDENIKLVAYIASMGYESYSVFADGKQYIGGGGGEITIF